MEGQTAASEENAALREEMRRLRAKLAAAESSRLSGQPSFSLEESRAARSDLQRFDLSGGNYAALKYFHRYMSGI